MSMEFESEKKKFFSFHVKDSNENSVGNIISLVDKFMLEIIFSNYLFPHENRAIL